MRLHSVAIYCLPNIRRPWVLVYEPHPWGHGALRVAEEKAVLVYRRAPTRFELEWSADFVRHVSRTFDTEAQVLDYEDGQHERADEVREAIEFRRRAVDAVYAEVGRKRAAKRADERRRVRLATATTPPEGDDDGDDGSAT